MSMKKVWHDKRKRVEYEGEFWILDVASWRGADGKGKLRIYRIEGDINSHNLKPAIQNLADAEGLSWSIETK